MCAFVVYCGANGYFKDELQLPPNQVVEIDDRLVNQARGIKNVRIVSLPVETKNVKILEETNGISKGT